MWIFTKHGFFSAVCACLGDGKHGRPVDPDRIMVRSRVRQHLDALIKRFPDLLTECDIQESAGTDYAYRPFVQKSGWIQVLARLAEETDYDNLKWKSLSTGKSRCGLRAFAARGLVSDEAVTMTPDSPIREPDQIRQDAARKLRDVQVSDHFQAIIGCLLGEDWTTPRLIEMAITPDATFSVAAKAG